jgi:hypothetical protein
MVWPSASRAWDLLNGVKMDNISPPQYHDLARYKRPADDAFGHEKGPPPQQVSKDAHHEGDNGVQDLSARIMAQMFGYHIPGIEPSTSFLPGYEWWPRSDGDSRSATHGESPNPHALPPSSSGGIIEAPNEWSQGSVPNMNYSFDFGRF